jgi:hypothetical protein
VKPFEIRLSVDLDASSSGAYCPAVILDHPAAQVRRWPAYPTFVFQMLPGYSLLP